MSVDIKIDYANMSDETTAIMVNEIFKKHNFRIFKQTLKPAELELIEEFEKSATSPMLNPEYRKSYYTGFQMCMNYCMDNSAFIPDTTVSELKEANNKSTLNYEDYYKAFFTWIAIVLKNKKQPNGRCLGRVREPGDKCNHSLVCKKATLCGRGRGGKDVEKHL